MPRGRFISDERRAKIVELYAQGHSRVAIMQMVGASFAGVTAALERSGVPLRAGRERKISPAVGEAMIHRYAAGAGMAALAEAYGVSPLSVRKWFDRHGVVRRDDRGRTRVYTPEEVETIRRMAAEGASQNAIAKALNSAQTTVSKLMAKHGIAPARTGAAKNERHHRWKGGRFQDAGGYWRVKVTPDSPFRAMADLRGYAMEHRLVMAQHLGRPLTPDEEAHHINGDKTDNRLENLQLRAGKHGKGVCYRCLDCGSMNVVAVELAEG